MAQGTPLNPLVDLGQLEGGFMMAIGYFLTEEVVFAEGSGEQLTLGAWEYKVPHACAMHVHVVCMCMCMCGVPVRCWSRDALP